MKFGGKEVNTDPNPEFVFLLSAEWVDLKYSTPINEKEYTSEEIAAAVKIQSMWKGCYVRLLMKARKPGMVLRNLK
jgi:hypothetical protein